MKEEDDNHDTSDAKRVEVRPEDVVGGPGRLIVRTPGNDHFERLINRYAKLYASSGVNMSMREVQDNVLSELLPGSRMLSHYDRVEETGVIMKASAVRRKIGQAIRYRNSTRYQQRVCRRGETGAAHSSQKVSSGEESTPVASSLAPTKCSYGISETAASASEGPQCPMALNSMLHVQNLPRLPCPLQVNLADYGPFHRRSTSSGGDLSQRTGSNDAGTVTHFGHTLTSMPYPWWPDMQNFGIPWSQPGDENPVASHESSSTYVRNRAFSEEAASGKLFKQEASSADSCGIPVRHPKDPSNQDHAGPMEFPSCGTTATSTSVAPPHSFAMPPELFQLSGTDHRSHDSSTAALQIKPCATNPCATNSHEGHPPSSVHSANVWELHGSVIEDEDINDLWQHEPLEIDDFHDTPSYFQEPGTDTW